MKRYIHLLIWINVLLACQCRTSKSELGVVSTASPEATEAGVQMLRAGGNVVDAAIAVSFALAVTEPMMSGLGGGTQVLLAFEGQLPIAINGTTFSPAATPLDVGDTLTYHRKTTIPSTVRVLDYLYRKYASGKLGWSELIEPAIALARDGYQPGPYQVKAFRKYEGALMKSPFGAGHFIPTEISGNLILKQPVIAETLRRIANDPMEFYRGKMAAQIASDMRNNGGWITLDDLSNFPEPQELKPLQYQVGLHIVYTQPPPCGGWVSLLGHALTSKISPSKWQQKEMMVRILHTMHADRKLSPVTNLTNFGPDIAHKLSQEYLDSLLSKIHPDLEFIEINESGETTHFSVMDAERNMIAVTSSINAIYGARAASPELGFLYNTYMDDFVFSDPEHPFAIGPGKMAFSSMSPTILRRDGKNVLALGSPGSARIISSVMQIAARWMSAQNIQHQVALPRIHVSGNSVYFENKDDSVLIDAPWAQARGLKCKWPNEDLVIRPGINAWYGGVHAVAVENGKMTGAADHRRDGLCKTVYTKRNGK